MLIDSTKKSERVKLKGMFQDARVKRGPDWEKGDEDVAVNTVLLFYLNQN